MQWGRGSARVAALLGALLALTLIMPAAGQEAESNFDEQPPEDRRSIGGNTFRVFAHRLGLVGRTTANGHVIQPNDFFVTLPCWCSLSERGGDEFQVRLEYGDESIVVPVWDVGPWNVEDNYWDPPSERTWSGLPQGIPQAEAAYYDGYNGGLDDRGRQVQSPAGMDIADGAFAALGMTTSDWVDVTFLWLEPDEARVQQELPPLPESFSDIPTVWWDERPPLDPAEPDDPARYEFIPETSHNVPHQLMNYWHATGGWRIHGLPNSEFFRRVKRDETVEFVQYFERSILEVVWTEDGSGLQILRRPLGYEAYIDPVAQEPVEPFPADDWARYFPETGHALGGGFRVYWEQNGGEAVFGKPISGEWSATSRSGQPVVMQMFEYARLEWWPENMSDPNKDDITLGLLTVEMLERAGWLERPE